MSSPWIALMTAAALAIGLTLSIVIHSDSEVAALLRSDQAERNALSKSDHDAMCARLGPDAAALARSCR